MTRKSFVLALGLAFHLVFIWSVFDCYFTSPVVHGMRHFSTGHAPAKRLVLFVADGLRADLLYNVDPFPSVPNSPSIVAPFLRKVAEERGAFGVSHTHVPTESRPGHVALIAGMYEDVSAVTKGWKTNPVNFDSVFNQTSQTFSFGSPDILPMFAKGAVEHRVNMWSYDEEEEDFTRDATELDIWSFNQLRLLLSNASSDHSLNARVRGPRTVFFLHLLGLDTTGHSYRPHSKEYMRNIQVVDDIVNKTERLLTDFFRDDLTSYVFTADHGMSNIGNHGDGNPDTTRTPLLAWGAGIRGPIKDPGSLSHDEYSSTWGNSLTSLLRQDVEQADIAPLMSALIGTNFPVNSVGVIPDIHSRGFLNADEEKRAHLALSNAQVILEQYRIKHAQTSSRKLFYKEYKPLKGTVGLLPGEDHTSRVEYALKRKDWESARRQSLALLHLSLEGLRYVQVYDRSLLSTIALLGYMGWSIFSAIALLLPVEQSAFSPPKLFKLVVNAFTTVSLTATMGVFAIQHEPITYYIYVAFVVGFWRSITFRLWEPLKNSITGWNDTLDQPDQTSKLMSVAKVLMALVFVVAALQGMVIAYTHRWVWSVGFIVTGILWPIIAWPARLKREQTTFFKWMFASLLTAAFPLRNVEQRESLFNILAGGLVMITGPAVLLSRTNAGVLDVARQRRVIIQLSLSVAAMLLTADSVRRLQAKSGLPIINRVFGWTLFVSSIAVPLLSPFRSWRTSEKLMTLFLTFVPCFVILVINAEGLFFASYCYMLVIWIDVEDKVRGATVSENQKLQGSRIHRVSTASSNSRQYTPRWDDLRIALFFIFFVQVAFFGTGNVASISSFYLEPVYRLVPVFNPFLMAALLIFKIVAPYVFLSGVFATLNRRLNLPPFSLFLIALSLTDVMTVTFFFRVTDTGSWLEIGQSISFFVITSLLLVWSAGICALGEWLMVSPETTDDSKKQR